MDLEHYSEIQADLEHTNSRARPFEDSRDVTSNAPQTACPKGAGPSVELSTPSHVETHVPAAAPGPRPAGKAQLVGDEDGADPAMRSLNELVAAMLRLLSRVECFAGETRDVNVVDREVDAGYIECLVREARSRLGESFAPNATFIKGLKDANLLDDMTPELYERHEEKISECESLEEWLTEGIHPKLADNRGLGPREEMGDLMRRHGIDQETHDKVLSLMYEGQVTPLNSSFVPNEGTGVHLGQYYNTIAPIFIHELNRRGHNGDVVIAKESTLMERGLIPGSGCHVGTMAHALKDGSKLGRTCFNGSYGIQSGSSLNQGIDEGAMDETYPPPKLTDLADLCEFVCEVKEAYPGEPLGAATIDYKEAYALTPQSASSAKLHAVRMKVPDPRNFLLKIVLIAFFVVGAWGFTRAGNVFCLMSSTICKMHNYGRRKAKRRSVMYIDDGIFVDRLSMIFATPKAARDLDQTAHGPSVKKYVQLSRDMLGVDCIQPKKLKLFNNNLTAIGWHLDFESETARPNQKGMDKLIVRLFESVKVGDQSIGAKDLEKLTGTLMRYSSVLLCGCSFVGSLYALQCKGEEKRYPTILLTPLALSDLEWWRAIALVAVQRPGMMGGTFSMLRTNRTPTRFIRTDASSKVGGGGIQSYVPFTLTNPFGLEVPGTEGDSVVRWTQEELDVFVRMGVSINVLEYFMVVFCIILWGEDLRGQVVQEESDSSTAISWLLKRRAKGSYAADAMSKILTTYNFINRIALSPPKHVLGVDNGVSDDRSRSLNLQEMVSYAGGPIELDEELLSRKSRRWLACRKLLMTCITRAEEMRGQSLLQALTNLSSISGEPTVKPSGSTCS